MSVDPASLFERDSYRLMISAFVPRVRRQPGYGGNRRKMNQASGDYAASVSEFDEAGLTRAPAEAVQVARIGESPVNFECRLIRAIRVADNIVFLGRVVRLRSR